MTDSDADYVETLRANRREKDDFFGSHPQSPVPPAEREDFEGLDYFDPNLDYRVEATATRHDDPDPVPMETNTGEEVRYVRVVTFEVELGEANIRLHGYKQRPDDADEPVFVPFRDKTTGQQTYRGGRYLELHPEGDLVDGETVVIDFNLAYTPFCAFSEAFSCPLPPEENWLDVAVAAGERDPTN
ncbi:DUF1684 domain-containing protein [Halobellus rufus]|uniref:DUF1684 domain-containing protein n=1 Tax=Halobellus rufus TaxID=1448860 RepID=UPI000678AB64|nr:DUF1684 domain-containing protein [Halobellus rufus]